jgi:tetratricopeptide (TPR) repeat protein
MDFKKIYERICSAGEFPRSWPPAWRGALWLAGAFAAAFLVYPDGLLYPVRASNLLTVAGSFFSQGKPLVYGLAVETTRMPLIGVMSLAAGNADWAGAQFLWSALAFLICLSGYGFGCLLAGRVAGVAAAAGLFAGQVYSAVFFDIEQRFYCLFLLVIANALVLACRSQRLGRLIEGCAIGLSFLARSALCWFPAVLAIAELFRPDGGRLRRRLLQAAIALLIPFLFLLPWIRFNYAAQQKFVLFDGRGDGNMVTGALGVASTFEGDYRKLAGMDQEENPFLWSAKRVLSHPGVYALGVIKRTNFIFSKYPAIFFFWLLFAALLWRKPAFRRVNLLVLYFLLLHFAFSSEERYFMAILPLMAAISAAGLFALGEKSSAAAPEGAAISAAGAAPVVLAGVLCMFLLLRYPGTAAVNRNETFKKALSRSPGDAWLQLQYGRYRLFRGDYEGAYESLGRAAVLLPDYEPGKIDLAAAAMLKNRRFGRPSAGADLIEKLPLNSEGGGQGLGYVLRAFYQLDEGLARKAAESAELVRQARSEYIHFKIKSDGEGRLGRARAEDTSLEEIALPKFLEYFPPELQAKLGPAFLQLYFKGDSKAPGRGLAPGSAASVPVSGLGELRAGGASKKFSDEAVERILKGDLAGARGLLAEAVKADEDNFEARMTLCFLAARTGDVSLGEENCGEAVFLSVKPPKHSIALKDRLPSAYYSRGVFYFKVGDKAKACLDMRRAVEAAPSGWPPARKELESSCAKP